MYRHCHPTCRAVGSLASFYMGAALCMDDFDIKQNLEPKSSCTLAAKKLKGQLSLQKECQT